MNDQAYGIKVETQRHILYSGQHKVIDVDPSLVRQILLWGKSSVSCQNILAGGFFFSSFFFNICQELATYPVSFDADGTGNIYITGSFYGTTDMIQGRQVINKTSLGAADIFYLRYDAAGNYEAFFYWEFS